MDMFLEGTEQVDHPGHHTVSLAADANAHPVEGKATKVRRPSMTYLILRFAGTTVRFLYITARQIRKGHKKVKVVAKGATIKLQSAFNRWSFVSSYE